MKILEVVNNRLQEVFKDKKYHLICVAITGSHAYGINTKDSDIDIIGIFLPPEDYILRVEHIDQIITTKEKDGYDGQIFSFSKWYNLMIQQNPNTIEILWSDENMYIYRDSEVWPKLVNNREKFLSKKIKHSCAGYAFSQVQRMKALNIKANQNEKRKEEIEKYGYSTKNCSHIFRLLGMALDALIEHQINVMRPERQFLIAIREGKYTYDEMVKMSNDKFQLIEQAYIASDLRNKIDDEFVKKLHLEILKNWLRRF
jgi:predicted nucleotidyltransferase